jgi:hypothetical protein
MVVAAGGGRAEAETGGRWHKVTASLGRRSIPGPGARRLSVGV